MNITINPFACPTCGSPNITACGCDVPQIRAGKAVLRSLPRVTGRDIVSEINLKREGAKKRKLRHRCLGTNSCDCPRCT